MCKKILEDQNKDQNSCIGVFNCVLNVKYLNQHFKNG